MTTHGKKGRGRPKLGKAKLPHKERLKRGFARVEQDLSWMMGIFRELLEELGEKEVGEALPWVHGSRHLPPIKEGKITRAYSIAFGLLNLAEEVAAAAMRQLNEAINGPQHEPGSWAQALCRLKSSGETTDHLAATLPTLRVEPVLTAHPTEARRPSILACTQEIYGILLERGGSPAKTAQTESAGTILRRCWSAGGERKRCGPSVPPWIWSGRGSFTVWPVPWPVRLPKRTVGSGTPGRWRALDGAGLSIPRCGPC